jgi:hypothetical protein
MSEPVAELRAVADAAAAYRKAYDAYEAFHMAIFHQCRAPNKAEETPGLEFYQACQHRRAALFAALDALEMADSPSGPRDSST